MNVTIIQPNINNMGGPSNFVGAFFIDNSRRMTDTPTYNDILLGRGVATNRHPGNANFRAIVSQHVNVYMISTKKEKMMISRSIVRKVQTELSPPGRFLEKIPKTGLWHEVGDKRALEKTAQALRDGAAPLKKKLSEDPNRLDSLIGKKHKYTETASTVAEVLSSSESATQQPPLKRQRFDPSIVDSSTHMDKFFMAALRTPQVCPSSQQQQQQLEQNLSATFNPVPQNSQLSSVNYNTNYVQASFIMPSVSPLPWREEPVTMRQQHHQRRESNEVCSQSSEITETTMSQQQWQDQHWQAECDSVADAALVNDKIALDEEEFMREMGCDEHFFGLGTSDRLWDADFDGDVIFQQ